MVCSSDSIVFSAVTHESSLYLIISRAVSRRMYDSLLHDFLESYLDHCIATSPRGGLGLWILKKN